MESIKATKYLFVAADLLLLGLAAFFASQIILTVAVRTDIIAVDGSAVEGGSQVKPDVMRDNQADSEVVLERNLFNSRVGAGAPTQQEQDIKSDDLPESTLPLQLLGTVVNSKGGRSFAIIQDKGTREQDIYFPEDPVVEGVTLASVGRNKVVLLRNGREEILEKTDERVNAPKTRGARPRTAAKAPASRKDDITVRKVGDNNYVMDRREVEGVLQDFNKLLTQIRVVPHFSNGKPDGFKVFNIRPNSLFMKLGMVNGDIIKRVNGLDITGPEQALQMFQQLRDESRITLDLERFRKNLTLQYEVR
jgi:general secretion pathway protein C